MTYRRAGTAPEAPLGYRPLGHFRLAQAFLDIWDYSNRHGRAYRVIAGQAIRWASQQIIVRHEAECLDVTDAMAMSEELDFIRDALLGAHHLPAVRVVPER